jgi:GDSL-like lipase/acylhydrolase family protein
LALSSRRRVLARFVFLSLPALIVAVALACAVIEVWVRVAWDPRRGKPGFYVSDPVRGLRLGENYDGWFAGVPVHVNRLGLRDPREYDLAKGPNTFRILVLGDSVTFGHGSLYETTYPYLVEQRLRSWRPDVDWQVWNAAVPGYNTSQELAQLLEVGPRFQPDLVVVGFFENDVIDNKPYLQPTVARRVVSAAESFAQRHLYSLELYKRIYYEAAWRLSATDEYRRRVQHLGADDAENAAAADATHRKGQALTPFEWLTDDQVRRVRCVYGMRADAGVVEAIKASAGYSAWRDAVRGFADLEAAHRYRIVFFLNVVPPTCQDGDVFYDATRLVNAFYTQTFSAAAPTVSVHDAFLHVRPSQMPGASGHAFGNANVVKSDVLFSFLRDRVLAEALPPAPRAPAAR